MAALAVGAGLRLECRRLTTNREAEVPEHVLEHVIGLEAQTVVRDLERDVTVAQVVTGPRQLTGVEAARHRNLLAGSDYAHTTPILGLETIAVSEHLSPCEKHADFATAVELGAEAAPLSQ